MKMPKALRIPSINPGRRISRLKRTELSSFSPSNPPKDHPPGGQGPKAEFVQSEGAHEPEGPLGPTQDRSAFSSDKLCAN